MKKKLPEFNQKLQIIQHSGNPPKEASENEKKLLHNLINYGPNEESNQECKTQTKTKRRRGRKEQKQPYRKKLFLSNETKNFLSVKNEEIKRTTENLEFEELKGNIDQIINNNLMNTDEKFNENKNLENNKYLEIFEKVFDPKNLPNMNPLSSELKISDFESKINGNSDKIPLNDEVASKEPMNKDFFNCAKDYQKNYSSIDSFFLNTPIRKIFKESPFSHQDVNYNLIYDQFTNTNVTKNTEKNFEKKDDFIVEAAKFENNKDIAISPNIYLAKFDQYESPSKYFLINPKEFYFLYFIRLLNLSPFENHHLDFSSRKMFNSKAVYKSKSPYIKN